MGVADRRVGPAPIALVLVAALVLGAGNAQAQEVCSDTPGEGERVYCHESGTADITINASGVDIDTMGFAEHGISALHEGTGKIDIDVSGESTIETTGDRSSGVHARHTGTGDVDITVESATINIANSATSLSNPEFAGIFGELGDADTDVGELLIKATSTEIHTTDDWSIGVAGVHGGAGKIDITLERGSMIDTKGDQAHGVHAWRLDESGAGEVKITLSNTDIDTEGENAVGVFALHETEATTDADMNDVNITVTESSTIDTAGFLADGVSIDYRNTGDARVDVLNSTITTTGELAHGIKVLHSGIGDIDIEANGGSITTKGVGSNGIYAKHETPPQRLHDGDIIINTRNFTITTESVAENPDQSFQFIPVDSTFTPGIFAEHTTAGDINIDVRGGGITTRGSHSYGIFGLHSGTNSYGKIIINTQDGHAITTTGAFAHGIVAEYSQDSPDDPTDPKIISITVGGTVRAEGENANGVHVGRIEDDGGLNAAARDDEGYLRQTVTVNGEVTGGSGEAAGVYLAGGGRVVIGPRASIRADSGIAILATGHRFVAGIGRVEPKLYLDMRLNGRRLAQVFGDDYILNDDGETTIVLNGTTLHEGDTGVVLDENSDPVKAPNGVWDVTMSEHGFKVNDRTAADWMFTESTSAAKIIADRDFSAQDFTETLIPARLPSSPPPPPPMPRTVMVDEPVFGDADEEAGVHLLAGGRVVIGPAGTVGGESGIAILAARPPGGAAPMLHVDMTLDGRRVAEVIGDDYIVNDGGETTIVVNDVTLHEGATGVVEDAVALNGAFNVTMRPEGVTVDRTDPDNWVITEPAGGVVADRDFSTEDFIETSTQPMFTEEYAPRAALYEILPDFLLRLTGPGPGRRCGSTPDSSVWTRVAGGQGVYESDRSTTGATYDLERFEAEGGLSASLGARAKGWVSVRHVQGTAGVASPTGGGEIDVRGLGSSVGGSWRGANDVYAVGCFSYLAYDVDFASTRQGVLKAGVDGQAYTLDFEAGRRYAVGEQWDLTPRVWVVGSRVSVDDFTDAVDARVSLSGADRVLGGLGVLAETARPWGEGEFSLRGSLDFERMLRGATTTTQVSGEQLSADATENSLLVGLQGVYRQGRFTVGAEIAARQELGSTDSEYTSFLNLGISF